MKLKIIAFGFNKQKWVNYLLNLKDIKLINWLEERK